MNGGHPDHDSACFIASILRRSTECADLGGLPLYRMDKGRHGSSRGAQQIYQTDRDVEVITTDAQGHRLSAKKISRDVVAPRIDLCKSWCSDGSAPSWATVSGPRGWI